MSSTPRPAWTHHHAYDAGNPAGERSTRLVMWITLAMMVVEIVCGWWFNSMALLADGWHMSSHAFAIGLSAFAYAAARRLSKDHRFAFGTFKIEVLGGFASAILMFSVVALMLAKNASLTPDQVISMLQTTARAFPATCSQCGAGIVDATAAVTAAANGGGGGGGNPGTTIAEVESNNTRATAQSIANAGTTVNGSFSNSSDTDYYKVVLPAGKKLTAKLTPNSTSDYDLYLYNSSGTQLARSINGTGVADTVTYTNSGSSSLTLYVRAYFYSGKTGTTGTYTLNFAW